jgi:two-component system, OmpR family, osmolarity sensor histidine kinase EnvZ
VTDEEPSLYDRFNALLERYAPDDLYRRALAIMITPVVLLQLLLASVLVSRYLDNVANVLARTLADETALLVDLYEKSDKSPTALAYVKERAENNLHMRFEVKQNTTLGPGGSTAVLSLFDRRITAYLAQALHEPFRVNSSTKREEVEISVAVDPSTVFVLVVDANRAQAVGTPLVLMFMAIATLAFMAIAVVFMRNQIKPILDLTAAAQDFGKGRDSSNFQPMGAREVKAAGEAFIDMKRRIARHVEQRTVMLAGVSHDLRTVLTRFKLELAVLGDTPKTRPLREDVDEMQNMLEDYMAFARGDGGEKASPLKLREAVAAVADSFDKAAARIETGRIPDLTLLLKPNAFRRLLGNVLGNALRHGKAVRISGEERDERVWLFVDDDGPGIPPARREDVFRPFVRLDPARNLDKTGTGLGLAIALDIAHAHGGDIFLETSPMGGLRVAIKIPV